MHVVVKEEVYEVSRADLDRDRDAILALWARNLSSSDDSGRIARFAWQYKNNVAGQGRCWLLLHRPSGQIVGTAGLALRDISCERSSLKAGLAIDFAVDEPHRFLQPALMLQRSVFESLSNGVDFIYGLPNKKALPIFKRLGYNGPSPLLRMVKVLKTSAYLDRFPAPLRGIMGLGGDLLHRARSAETWMPGRGRSVVPLSGAGAEVDDLWQRVAGRYPMICRRTSAFVRWRYEQFPMVRYTLLGLYRENKTRLDGYAVVHVEENAQARVTDFVADGEKATEGLLVGLIRWARASDAASVAFEFGGDPRLETRLKYFGFVSRSSTAMLMSYFADTALQQRSAELLQKWRFSAGDMAYL
jgi:hypothetical protein